MNSEPPASRHVDPAPAFPRAPERPDDVAVVDEDISIVTVGDDDDVRALSERLRRVEEELDGVFETIGRLLRSGDAPNVETRRIAASVARLHDAEESVVGVLAEERDRISRALDEHFARLERVLTAGAAEPAAEPEAEPEASLGPADAAAAGPPASSTPPG